MASPAVHVGDSKPVGFHPKTPVGVTMGLGLAWQDGQPAVGHPAQLSAACLRAIWAMRVEVTCMSLVPHVSPAGGTVAPVAVPRRVQRAGDQPCAVHHPDLARGDVTAQESILGYMRGLVPAVPSPAWGSQWAHPRGHPPAGSGTGRGGCGPTPPSPSELTPEPSSPQLLPFAGSVPCFTVLSQPSAKIPVAGGVRVCSPKLYPWYRSHGITGI